LDRKVDVSILSSFEEYNLLYPPFPVTSTKSRSPLSTEAFRKLMILALLIDSGSCLFACSHTWRELNVSLLFQRMSSDMV
jgi:hypothetical protein